jgi:hypothetical protein
MVWRIGALSPRPLVDKPGGSMFARLLRPATAALLLGLLGAACGDPVGVTAPALGTPAAASSADLLGLVGQVTRLVCPTDVERTASAVVGPEGGMLAVDGVRVEFPAGAVASTETFTLRVLGGLFVEIDLSAAGSEHYTFATPVSVTLDLARCGSLPVGLRAFYLDSSTKALLEDMGGELDLLGHKLRFRTPHFSGYTVAW